MHLFIPVNSVLPKEDRTLSILRDGMYILQQPPIGIIEPAAFAADLVKYQQCIEKMPKTYSVTP